jgi:predicted nucleotidyltransferase
MMFKAAGNVEEIAQPVVDRLAGLDEVVAVLCFGSYALNSYDQHSDIDLYVVCDPAIIAEPTRRDIFEKLPGLSEVQLNYGVPGWDNHWSLQPDKFKLNQAAFDISYNTKAWISTVVDKVTAEGATSIPELPFRPYTLLGLLANAIILYDPQGFIQNLNHKLYPYSPRLKDHLIQENMPILLDRLNELQDGAVREIGNTAFLFHLWHACDAFISILFALNEQYDPATKRPEREFSKFKLAPANLATRYEKLLEGPFDRAGKRQTVEEFRGLIIDLMQFIG